MSHPFWSGGSCAVTVRHTDDGGVEFHGHDLAKGGVPGFEYEYFVTVPTDALPDLRRALGVDATADLLTAVIGCVDDIMPGGEATWLAAHGVGHRVSVWDSPPD